MQLYHTFISYSRADAEFALKLANDLRQAGVNIWLDQIDIPPGARWDRAVENALETSGRILVVLSPTSSDSENVQDEIGVAFDYKKPIIPVLYKPCEIPMRLRRLQHLDFTQNYDQGLRTLLTVMKLPITAPEGSSSAARPPATPPAKKSAPAISAAPEPKSKVATPSRRNMFIGLGAALLVVLLLWLWPRGSDTEQTEEPGQQAIQESPIPTTDQPETSSQPQTNPFWQARILVDTYHGGSLSFVAGMDGVALRNKGFVFKEAGESEWANQLFECEVLVIRFASYDGSKPRFSPEEISAVREYLDQGGGVLLVGLGWVWINYSIGKPPITDYPLNQLAEGSGIFFTDRAIGEVGGVNYEQAPITFRRPFMAEGHPLTEGVNQIAASKAAPGALTVAPPAIPIVWGDENTRDSNGVSKPIILAASTLGKGRLVCLQHAAYIEPFVNEYENKAFPNVYDNLRLFENILTWLSRG